MPPSLFITHKNAPHVSCEACGYVTHTNRRLRWHVENVHMEPKPEYRCRDCDFVTKGQLTMANHALDVHQTVLRGKLNAGSREAIQYSIEKILA